MLEFLKVCGLRGFDSNRSDPPTETEEFEDGDCHEPAGVTGACISV